MSVPNNTPSHESALAVTLTVGELRALVRGEIREAMGHDGDRATSTQDSHKPYLTVKEAADFSRLGQSTIRLLIRKRELKAHKVGERVIIKRIDLERFLESNPIQALSD